MLKVKAHGPIVMVDDNRSDFRIAEIYFKRSRLQRPFVYLSSGEALLAHLEAVTRGEAPVPALVLLDVNMPGLSGFETLKAVRAVERHRELPIAILTTSTRDSERTLAFRLGADDFITKPLTGKPYLELFNALAP